MKREPLIRLLWHGQETIDAVAGLLSRAERIEITLPANYNHVLFTKLNPDASDAALEDIETNGGPELLNQVAEVDGLEAFSTLVEALAEVRASIRIVSPPKLVIDMADAKPVTDE